MDEPTHARIGEYLIGLEGLAMLRAWGVRPDLVRERSDELAQLIARLDESPIAIRTEHQAVDGYRQVAPWYDEGRFNPMVVAEEPLVQALLAAAPPGAALDAACGTGRHAAFLASRGHKVIGVDISDEMLDVARAKVPSADFRRGDLPALPMDANSVDLAVCALALTHLPDPGPAIVEISRVLRSGGRLIISDVHPFMGEIGMHCNFPIAPGHMGFVRNHTHGASTYLAAFKGAGLQVNQCLEPTSGEAELATQAWAGDRQEAVRQALLGLPILIIWDLVRRP